MRDKSLPKMSKWGIGPIFILLSLIYSIIMISLTRYFYPTFQINIIPYPILVIIALILFIIGIPFFISSIITFKKAYNSNTLIKSGVYQYCRHPMYASWAVFIVPGITLIANSWLGLTVPVFMYIILYILVKKEEAYLEKVFGNEYYVYKQNTPCILPYGILFKKNHIINKST